VTSRQRALQGGIVQLEREVRHGRGHIHPPHCVADDARLLAHRDVGLIVFVGLGPIGGRVVAARQRLLGEIMRLTAALVDEIGGELEPSAVAGEAVELDERELDFLMARIAVPLPGSPAERRGDVVDAALHDVQEASPSGRSIVSDRAFEQMSGVVKLVVVAQIGPSLLGLAPVVPAVQVAVRGLRLGEVGDDRVDFGFDIRVAPQRERVARRLDPFAHVRVPEDLHREPMGVSRNGQRRDGLRQLQRAEDADLRKLGVLARNGAGENDLEPLSPEGACDADVRERHGGIFAFDHDRLLCPERRIRAARAAHDEERGKTGPLANRSRCPPTNDLRKNESDALSARRWLLYEAPHWPGRLAAEPGVLGNLIGSMTKVTYIDSTGQSRTVEAQVGSTVMETALRNSVPGIEAECGGACACATCHVYVAEEWTEKVGKPSQMEEDMLDFAFEVRPNSRLSCQIKVREELDGLVVTTPGKQG
jgi:2Fe-2S ferredoxin